MATTSRTDSDLLADDDAGSYELFYLRHVAAVRRFLGERTFDPRAADDLTVETFAVALAGRRGYEPASGDTHGWLIGIAEQALDEARRHGHVERPTADRLGIGAPANGEDFADALRRELRAAALREHGARSGRGLLAARSRPGRRRLALVAGAAGLLVAAAVLASVLLAGGEDEQPARGLRVTAVVGIGGSPDSVAAGFGSAWIAERVSGDILRVGPRFHQVQRRIHVGNRPIAAAGARAIWAVADGADAQRLLRIDPATNRVTARRTLLGPRGAPLTAVALEVIRGVPYVLGIEGLVRVDPSDASTRFSAFEPLEAEPLDLAAADDGLWILTRDGRLLQQDLRAGRPIASLPVRLPGTVAVLPTPAGPVLVARDGRIARADASDGRIVWSRTVGASVSGVPLRVGGALYVHVSDAPAGRDRLVEVALGSGRPGASVALPEFGARDVTAVGRELWISAPTGSLIVLRR